MPSTRAPRATLRSLGPRFVALLAISVAFTLVFAAGHLAAAPLLGPMVAAILMASRAGALEVPAPAFLFGQAIVGLLIARNIQPSILAEMSQDWPELVVSLMAVIGASALLGYLLARRQVLPGTTAIWGFFPGAASAMVFMSADFGADPRLVAFMQYLRVVLVALAASLVAKVWAPEGAGNVAHAAWFAPVDPRSLAETLAVAIGGGWIAHRFKVPAGSVLVPMVLGILLQDFGFMTIALPRWLLVGCYALVGWSIGLRFTPTVLAHAWAALPRVLVSMIVLIIVCGAFAAVLAEVMHTDALTAYLAMSPGGMDAVAIIASSSKADVPFVMAMQTGRLLVILAIGPRLARWLATRVEKSTAA